MDPFVHCKFNSGAEMLGGSLPVFRPSIKIGVFSQFNFNPDIIFNFAKIWNTSLKDHEDC